MQSMLHFKSKIIPIYLVLLSLMTTVSAQEGFILKNITYKGNETFSSSELSKHVSMHTVSWFSRNIMGEDSYIFSEDLLISDINSLKYYYQAEGFLDVSISHEFTDMDNEDRELSIIIHVNEGEAVVIDSVSFSFADVQNNMDGNSDSLLTAISENLQLKKGARFTDIRLESDEQMILRNYLKKNHFQNFLKNYHFQNIYFFPFF